MRMKLIGSLTLLSALAFAGVGLCQSSSLVSPDGLSRTTVGAIGGAFNKICINTATLCTDCNTAANIRCTVVELLRVCVSNNGTLCSPKDLDCGYITEYPDPFCGGFPQPTPNPCTGSDC